VTEDGRRPTRAALSAEDWQRARHFWTAGCTHFAKATGGPVEEPEDRGVRSVHGHAPLPSDTRLVARVRADLRRIGSTHSTRCSARLEVASELIGLEHTVVPHLNAEDFYDTRYDGGSRSLYQAGAEATLSKDFRYELCVGRPGTRLPDESSLKAFGLLAKWYC
jgi:hypothetical protein